MRLPQKSIWLTKVSGELLLAKVKQITTIGLERRTCLKVKITKNNFAEFNRMFYATSTEEWSLDPESKCRIGDVVLVRQIPEQHRPSKTVQYFVEKVVFQHGNFIDPVTKKRVFGAKEFEREVELRKDLVGEIFNDPLGEDESTVSDDELKRNKIRRRVAEQRSRKNEEEDTGDGEGEE